MKNPLTKIGVRIIYTILVISCSITNSTDHVLICTGQYAKAYHKDYKSEKSYCKGLRACRASIKRIEKSKITTRHACGYCW